MQTLNTKLHPPGDARLAARAARSLSEQMLGLQALLGAALSGLAVSAQLGNVLICLSMLLLGPSVILGLLP